MKNAPQRIPVILAILLLSLSMIGCAGKTYKVVISESPGFQFVTIPTFGQSGDTKNTPDIKPSLELSGLAELISDLDAVPDNGIVLAANKTRKKSWKAKLKDAVDRMLKSNLPKGDKEFWAALIKQASEHPVGGLAPVISISKSDTAYYYGSATRPGEE